MDNPVEIMRLCRLCLVKDQVNIPIFAEQGDIRQIFLKISSCLPVKVSRDDQLPKRICDGCSNKLDLLYEFWNTSANAEKTLLSWLGQAGVKDVDETISAVAQQIAKPPETQTQVKQEAPEDVHAAVQSTDHLELTDDTAAAFEENSTKDESDEPEPPPPKRARRTAAVKAQINIAPDSDEDDDDFDSTEPLTKIEDESDDSDLEKDPSYVDVPGTSADDQPGPSGVGKDGVEAPFWMAIVKGEPTDFPLLSKSAHQCVQCGKTFKKRYWLRRHMITHTSERPFKCPKCPKTFKTEYCQTQHALKMHDSRKTFQCESCQRLFMSQYRLSIHTLRHTNEFVVKCEFCGQGFFDKYQHRLHLESKHSENQSICLICGKSMSNKYNLKIHMHIHEKREERAPQICPYCKKGYKFLKPHIRRAHTDKQTLVCELCGKKFAGKDGLKIHLMIHQGIKPFQCQYCEKMFTLKDNLKLHIRTHTGERPYQCTECGKCFSQRSPLKIHMRIHSGEKPYDCELCNAKFSSKMVLNTHKKSVHKLV